MEMNMIKNILISPDSFKGGISSRQFCEIASDEIKRICPEARCGRCPIADGGEGTLESLFARSEAKQIVRLQKDRITRQFMLKYSSQRKMKR